MQRLRLATAADAPEIAAIYAPFVAHTSVSFEAIPPTPQDIVAILARAAGMWPWVVCERDGRVAGYAYAGLHRERAAYRYSVNVSAYVREGDRGQGVGRATYTALLRLLEVLRYQSVFAGITLPNEASVAFHRTMGFDDVGRYRNVGFKAGAWHDTLWLGRALGTHPIPPPEPLPLRAIDARTIDALLDPTSPAL